LQKQNKKSVWVSQCGKQEKIGLSPNAKCNDILFEIPDIETDVCFIFKTLPVLEQLEKKISIRLLSQIKSKFIVVSFPTRTLCGKKVNMSVNYEEFISNISDELQLNFQKLSFVNEDFYVLHC